MKEFLKTLLGALLLLSSVYTIGAQPQRGRGEGMSSSSASAPFISLVGGFSISVPMSNSGFRGLRIGETGGLGTGALYHFRQPDVDFQFGFIDLAPNSRSLKPAELRERLTKFHQKLFEYELENAEFTDRTFKGFPSIEVTAELFSQHLIRYVLTDETMFVLVAKTSNSDRIKFIQDVFDSWSHLPRAELLARKLAEVTPQPLPQSISDNRISSDAVDEGFKGKVKYVLRQDEDLTGMWYSVGPSNREELFFNESGNLLKHVLYNYQGLPDTVAAYGYVDGLRVSKSGSIDYDSLAPISMKVEKANKRMKKADSRYDQQMVYQYDRQKRLISEIVYDNRKVVVSRTVISYIGNRVVSRRYGFDGKLDLTTTDTLDPKGNVIEQTLAWAGSPSLNSTYTFKYESFDERGNWLRMLVEATEPGNDGKVNTQKYYSYRKITYYE